MAYDLLGKNFVPPDVHGKVTGKAKYAEDFRAEGMVFCKLLLSPMPHARVTNVDASAALAMPGVHGVLTADEVPPTAGARPSRSSPTSRCWSATRSSPSPPTREELAQRRDRADQGRLTRSCRSRSIRCRACSPAAPTRAPTATSSTTVDRPAAAQEREVDGARFRARRAKASCRWASRVAEWSFGDVDAGFAKAAARARRDVRDGRHVASLDGAALGDGVLAERQVLLLRLDAEPELRRAGHRELARHRRRTSSSTSPSSAAAASARRARAYPRDGDPGADGEEDRPARDDAHHARTRSTSWAPRARASRAA